MTNATENYVAQALLALGLAALLGCTYKCRLPPGTCENEQLGEAPSPDKAWKSVVFYRHCGCEGSEIEISVLPATAPLPNAPGNALRADSTNSVRLQQAWKGPHELSISHDQKMNLAFAAPQVGPVRIVHSVGELPGYP
jgi:hypothetical protein